MRDPGVLVAHFNSVFGLTVGFICLILGLYSLYQLIKIVITTPDERKYDMSPLVGIFIISFVVCFFISFVHLGNTYNWIGYLVPEWRCEFDYTYRC